MENKKTDFEIHFRQYVEEMRQYDPDFCEEDEFEDFMNTVKDMCVVMPVKNGNKTAGFLALSAKDCHPDCGWYIHHAFIEKGYRHKGLMTKTVLLWMAGTGGTVYGYDVIKDSPNSEGNYYAEGYWKHVFEDVLGKIMDVKPVELTPCRDPAVEEKLQVHAYRVYPKDL